MKPIHVLLATSFLLTATKAHAGGDWYPVVVTSLEVNDTDYILKVKPTEKTPHGFPSICQKFEVHGTYSWWHSWRGFPSGVTRENHRKALDYLNDARIKKKVINFGFMGSGFESIDLQNPCIVRSRALDLMENQGSLSKDKGVVSYYNRV